MQLLKQFANWFFWISFFQPQRIFIVLYRESTSFRSIFNGNTEASKRFRCGYVVFTAEAQGHEF